MNSPCGRRKERLILEKCNRSHQPAQHGLGRPEHIHMPPLPFWPGTLSSTDPPPTSSLPLPAPLLNCLWGCSMKWARESLQVKNDHTRPSPFPSFVALFYTWISFLFLLDGWHCSSGDDTSEGVVGMQSDPSRRHHWVPKSFFRTDYRPKSACS